jgi:hypothetical protein
MLLDRKKSEALLFLLMATISIFIVLLVIVLLVILRRLSLDVSLGELLMFLLLSLLQ